MIQRHRELDSFFDECGVPGPNPAEKTSGTAAKHKKKKKNQKTRMCSAGIADAVQKVGGKNNDLSLTNIKAFRSTFFSQLFSITPRPFPNLVY